MTAPRIPRHPALAAIALALLALAGCSGPYVQKYRVGVAANRQNLESLRVGMSRSEAEATMGRGTIVDYKRVQLRNPWRTERMRTDDGRTLDVLFYVTDGEVWRALRQDNILTPVLFENDKLVGWGKGFLESKRPPYVSGPPDPAH